MKNKICICVLAFKRTKMLRNSLESVIAQQTPPDSELLLVVMDNDSEKSPKPVFDSMHFPFPAFYEVEPIEGIPYSRNALIVHAIAKKSTHILFVDDDMRLPPDYAKKMLAEMNRKNADAVRGKMVTIDGNGKRSSIRRASLFSRQDILPGNGVLIGKRIYDDWGLRFDTRQTRLMEDASFFYRAYLRGARLYHVENAFFEEDRPINRGIPKDEKFKLLWIMWGSAYKVAIRRHLGGFWRGLWFALRHSLPILLLQIPANILLLPFAPKKRSDKIAVLCTKCAGYVSGLWMRELPGTEEAYNKTYNNPKYR